MGTRCYLAAVSPLLSDCITPPSVGEPTTSDVTVKVCPVGRFELVLEPSTSKEAVPAEGFNS